MRDIRIINIHNRLAVAFGVASQIKALHSKSSVFCFDAIDERSSKQTWTRGTFNPAPIEAIARFGVLMRRLLRERPGTIVACLNRHDPEAVTTFSLLLGGFMILGEGRGFEETVRAFQPLARYFVRFTDGQPGSPSDRDNLTLQDCWKALVSARREGWLDFSGKIKLSSKAFDRGSLDLDVHAHYLKPQNGRVCMIVPGHVVVSSRPVDLGGEALWLDGSSGKRHFSPEFYADIFYNEYSVSVVMNLEDDRSAPYDKDPFYQRDIDVEDLVLQDSRLSFSVADRFITVAKISPGPVAVHCGYELETGPVGTLVVTFLIRHLRFEPKAAVAWVRMLLPELLVDAPRSASPLESTWTRYPLDSSEDLPEQPSCAAANGRCGLPRGWRRNSVF